MSSRLNYAKAKRAERFQRSESDRESTAAAGRHERALESYRAAGAAVPPERRLYLNVPYAQRHDAKKLGCMWDKARKAWWTVAAPETLPGNWLVEPQEIKQTRPERSKVRERKLRRQWTNNELANRAIDLAVSQETE